MNLERFALFSSQNLQFAFHQQVLTLDFLNFDWSILAISKHEVHGFDWSILAISKHEVHGGHFMIIFTLTVYTLFFPRPFLTQCSNWMLRMFVGRKWFSITHFTTFLLSLLQGWTVGRWPKTSTSFLDLRTKFRLGSTSYPNGSSVADPIVDAIEQRRFPRSEFWTRQWSVTSEPLIVSVLLPIDYSCLPS